MEKAKIKTVTLTKEEIVALTTGYNSATNQFKWMQVESKDVLIQTTSANCVPMGLFLWCQHTTGGGEWKRVEMKKQ